jgi:hypothetical protein
VYVIGAVPVHVPVDADSVWLCAVEPVIAGRVAFTGGPAVTTAEAAEVAGALPTEFDAVTTTRSVEPTSAATTRYEAVVVARFVHEAPAELHRCH